MTEAWTYAGGSINWCGFDLNAEHLEDVWMCKPYIAKAAIEELHRLVRLNDPAYQAKIKKAENIMRDLISMDEEDRMYLMHVMDPSVRLRLKEAFSL